MNKEKCRAIFERFYAHNPHPTTELHYSSNFELLIAVMLSAHATDTSVNKATAKLFAVARTPQDILHLGEDELKFFIKSIGLFNNKAKNITKTCQILVQKYHGRVPNNREALEDLPGVGRKTCNVILNTLFAIPVIAVDTHIFRIVQRIGIAKGSTPHAIELELMRKVDQQFLLKAHHWLVLHGRYICVARKPRCYKCIICDLCEYKKKNLLILQ